ncbi:UNVERIFIED_ORG: hypothetical protein J2Y78_004866 [Buttiauxella agrestis ATCC 33320]
MSGRIGKGSLCDPFSLDDGVKGKAGHNILGNGAKFPLSTRVAGNYRKWKTQRKGGFQQPLRFWPLKLVIADLRSQ